MLRAVLCVLIEACCASASRNLPALPWSALCVGAASRACPLPPPSPYPWPPRGTLPAAMGMKLWYESQVTKIDRLPGATTKYAITIRTKNGVVSVRSPQPATGGGGERQPGHGSRVRLHVGALRMTPEPAEYVCRPAADQASQKKTRWALEGRRLEHPAPTLTSCPTPHAPLHLRPCRKS